MDKLMNASNASGVGRVLIEGEYVGYVAKRDMTRDSYKIIFIGGSPITEQSDWFTIEEFNYYEEIECSTGNDTINKDYEKLKRTLRHLYEKEEPVYFVVKNNKIYPTGLYTLDKVEKKTAMIISTYHELYTEDMACYRLPESSSRNEVGSSNWLMNKYANQPDGTNRMNAVLFNNTLIDLEWCRVKEYKLNLLDILEVAVENKVWTPAGLSSHICTYKEPK